MGSKVWLLSAVWTCTVAQKSAQTAAGYADPAVSWHFSLPAARLSSATTIQPGDTSNRETVSSVSHGVSDSYGSSGYNVYEQPSVKPENLQTLLHSQRLSAPQKLIPGSLFTSPVQPETAGNLLHGTGINIGRGVGGYYDVPSGFKAYGPSSGLTGNLQSLLQAQRSSSQSQSIPGSRFTSAVQPHSVGSVLHGSGINFGRGVGGYYAVPSGFKAYGPSSGLTGNLQGLLHGERSSAQPQSIPGSRFTSAVQPASVGNLLHGAGINFGRGLGGYYDVPTGFKAYSPSSGLAGNIQNLLQDNKLPTQLQLPADIRVSSPVRPSLFVDPVYRGSISNRENGGYNNVNVSSGYAVHEPSLSPAEQFQRLYHSSRLSARPYPLRPYNNNELSASSHPSTETHVSSHVPEPSPCAYHSLHDHTNEFINNIPIPKVIHALLNSLPYSGF